MPLISFVQMLSKLIDCTLYISCTFYIVNSENTPYMIQLNIVQDFDPLVFIQRHEMKAFQSNAHPRGGRSLYCQYQVGQVWMCQEGRTGVLHKSTPMNRQIHTSEYITFQQLRWRAVDICVPLELPEMSVICAHIFLQNNSGRKERMVSLHRRDILDTR